jgi:dihydrofolate reductase
MVFTEAGLSGYAGGMNRLIVAFDRRRGMAKLGGLPWWIPSDEKYYNDQIELYGGNALMGRATFDSYKHGPPKKLNNIVLSSSDMPVPEGVRLAHDLSAVLDEFADKDLWVIGGAAVFQQVMELGRADELYITRIDADFNCDRFFPEFSEEHYRLAIQSEEQEENGFRFRFEIWRKA